MLSFIFHWRSVQLGLPTPFLALYRLFLSLVSSTKEDLPPPWNFRTYANQSFTLHSATALGLAWLLAVLKLWWATAWDLVLVGKLWLERLLEMLASGVSSKSQSKWMGEATSSTLAYLTRCIPLFFAKAHFPSIKL